MLEIVITILLIINIFVMIRQESLLKILKNVFEEFRRILDNK